MNVSLRGAYDFEGEAMTLRGPIEFGGPLLTLRGPFDFEGALFEGPFEVYIFIFGAS